MNRTLPRRALATLPALAAAGTLLLAGPATAAPTPSGHRYVRTTALVPVLDGPSDDHHATIDTALYVPDNARAASPQPAILMTHGFGLSKDAAEVTSTADFLARHGYVVLTYTSQGFGASSGCIRLDSADYDVKDARQLLDKLLEPRRDVRHDKKGVVVGMLGGSYGGGITLNVAEHDPRIRVIVPGRTWNSLQYALDPNNRVVPGDPTGFSHQLADQGVFKFEWTSLFFASGNATPLGGLPPSGPPQGGCPQEKLASGDPVTVAGAACTGYPAELCQVYATIAATGDAPAEGKALLARSSGETFIDQLNVPTLLVQGQSDTLFNENDAVATFLALRRRGVPVAMTWNSGGHGGYDSKPGECEVYGGGTTGLDDCYLPRRTLQWLDRWLRGTPLRDFPTFTYYRDWVPYPGAGPDDQQYGAATAFPAQQAAVFPLSGADRLAAPGSTPVAGSAQFLNPPGGEPASYSETSNFSAPGGQFAGVAPSDPPQESVSFTSQPFPRDVVSVGVPSAHLHLSHVNGQDLVFFGKVFDVAPDGSATLIHRLIAPVRVPAAEVGKPVDLHLLGFAHRFAKGHAVRLTLAATDQTSSNSKVPDAITVTTGGSDPSTFSLPVSSTRAVAATAAPDPPAAAQSASAQGTLATTGLPVGLPIAALAVLAAALLSRWGSPHRHGR